MTTAETVPAVPALYTCDVRHVRTAPRRHTLRLRTYLWLIDPDRPPRLPRPLRPLARFDARDHFGGTRPTIRAGLAAFLAVHRIVDIAWGLAFTAVAVVSYVVSADDGGDGARRLLVTVLTAVWGLRLAGHIAARGRGHGEDPRYEAMLDRAPGNRNLYALRMVYLLQGALVVLVSLPVQAAQYIAGPPGPVAYAGCAVWLVGLVFEAVGDGQLARFKADPANRGRVMDRGLWSWTRHPNYFGDFCVWWGLFLIVCDEPAAAAATVAGPVVMSLLLVEGSGKRLLERHMANRPGFAEYTARTSGFLPLPPKRTKAG